MSPIPAGRIIIPNVGHGMNGGQPLPPAVYQGASLAPIHPPGLPDLSHVHADPTDRASEGRAHQGLVRLHTPQTEAGAVVAEVAHLAARLVDPHPLAEARPVAELYPRMRPRPRPSVRTAWVGAQLQDGCAVRRRAASRGRRWHEPRPLLGDPALRPEHQEAAKALA